MKGETQLSEYNNSWFNPGAGKLKRLMWYFVNLLIFRSGILPISSVKVMLLKMFSAKIGKGVVIKPVVNIKYPWNLKIGDHSWIGENVWIDNLVFVSISSNCCLSQGSMLLTGNHNYKNRSFDLMVGEIILEDGVWIGAHAVVCPGVSCFSHSVLSVNSVASSDLKAYTIYQGNPAKEVKDRKFEK